MLVLPTGQILFTHFFEVDIFTPTGSYNPGWAPRIQRAPATVNPGGSYVISGHLFKDSRKGLPMETMPVRHELSGTERT